LWSDALEDGIFGRNLCQLYGGDTASGPMSDSESLSRLQSMLRTVESFPGFGTGVVGLAVLLHAEAFLPDRPRWAPWLQTLPQPPAVGLLLSLGADAVTVLSGAGEAVAPQLHAAFSAEHYGWLVFRHGIAGESPRVYGTDLGDKSMLRKQFRWALSTVIARRWQLVAGLAPRPGGGAPVRRVGGGLELSGSAVPGGVPLPVLGSEWSVHPGRDDGAPAAVLLGPALLPALDVVLAPGWWIRCESEDAGVACPPGNASEVIGAVSPPSRWVPHRLANGSVFALPDLRVALFAAPSAGVAAEPGDAAAAADTGAEAGARLWRPSVRPGTAFPAGGPVPGTAGGAEAWTVTDGPGWGAGVPSRAEGPCAADVAATVGVPPGRDEDAMAPDLVLGSEAALYELPGGDMAWAAALPPRDRRALPTDCSLLALPVPRADGSAKVRDVLARALLASTGAVTLDADGSDGVVASLIRATSPLPAEVWQSARLLSSWECMSAGGSELRLDEVTSGAKLCTAGERGAVAVVRSAVGAHLAAVRRAWAQGVRMGLLPVPPAGAAEEARALMSQGASGATLRSAAIEGPRLVAALSPQGRTVARILLAARRALLAALGECTRYWLTLLPAGGHIAA